MKQEIHNRIREIELDRLSGASELASKALSVLKFLVRTNDKETIEGFLEDFYDTGKRLFVMKPNMAPIQNLVGQIVYEVRTKKERDLISLRDFVVSRIEELCRNSEIAAKRASEYGAEMINDSDNVITCSYSSTIFKTFKIAKQQGKNFDVLVAESKSGKFRYGRVLAGELESNGIATEVFPDDAIYHYTSRAMKVLVGADSILADGSLINGIPTYKVALAAKENGVPFYTVCETTKFNVLNYLGRKSKLEEGFDLTSSNLITGIITENGIIEVHEVINLMKEMEKYFPHE